MRFIAVYLLVCAARMAMPGLQDKDRNSIFMIRLGFAGVGAGISYGFLDFCMHGYIDRDPPSALHIALILFLLVAAIGEYLTRRILRTLNVVPANKRIPWTY